MSCRHSTHDLLSLNLPHLPHPIFYDLDRWATHIKYVQVYKKVVTKLPIIPTSLYHLPCLSPIPQEFPVHICCFSEFFQYFSNESKVQVVKELVLVKLKKPYHVYYILSRIP